MNITVFGANGQIGQQLLNIALQNGDKVKAVVRREGALNLTHPNLEIIIANYNDEAQVTAVITGQDAVVSTLGPSLNGGRKVTSLPIRDAQIAPRPVQKKLPMWIGVGGTPASAVRAGKLGANMALGLLGGEPERVQHLTNLYWQAANEAGHDLSQLKVSVTGHGYIAEDGAQAIREFTPHYNQYMTHFMKDRGMPFYPMAPEQLMPQRVANQILAVGSAEELAEKILYQHELFGHLRFMGQFDMGNQPLARVEKAIDLLANKVIPIVRSALNKQF